MTKRHLTIATRESPLAIKQAEAIKAALLKHHPTLTIDLLGLTTQGDKRLEVPLTEIGGKGLFVKELEEALLDKRADIAVHSMKDMPMDLPPGLCLPVMSEREDPRDVFVSNLYPSLLQMPNNTSLGTSSLRRQMQLHALRPDLTLHTLRGNIQTRLRRLDEGHFAAIILAAAGLKRMGLADRIRRYLSLEECLPAAGQGALGIECREDDHATQALIAPLNHVETQICVTAERELCRLLGGGCQAPVAAYAALHKEELTLRGVVINKSGTRALRVAVSGNKNQAFVLGKRAFEELSQQGASKILAEYV